MKFLTQTFSARKTYQIKVTFSEATSVKLMSKRNLDKYRKSQTHTYWGGHFDNSPVVFNVPNDGQWAVVVEKGTHHAPKDIKASVEIIKGGGLEATALPGGGSVAAPSKAIEEPVAAVEESHEEEHTQENEAVVAETEITTDEEEENKSE